MEVLLMMVNRELADGPGTYWLTCRSRACAYYLICLLSSASGLRSQLHDSVASGRYMEQLWSKQQPDKCHLQCVQLGRSVGRSEGREQRREGATAASGSLPTEASRREGLQLRETQAVQNGAGCLSWRVTLSLSLTSLSSDVGLKCGGVMLLHLVMRSMPFLTWTMRAKMRPGEVVAEYSKCAEM